MTISSVPNHSPSLFLSLPLPLSPSPSSFRQRETVKGKGEWVCQMYPHVLYRWDHVIRFLWLCCFSQSPLRRGEGSKKIFKASKKIFPWGSKHKYLITSKKYSPIPCFLWLLQQFVQDIGPRHRAFAGLNAAVSTAPATLWSSIFWCSMVSLKLTLV